MDEATLELLIKQASEADGVTIDFCWHGGEPLLAGKGFYQKAFQHQERWFSAGNRPRNIVQTNGLLLDKSFVAFFADHAASIGFSLDGPDVEANRYRFRPHNAERDLQKTLDAMLLVKQAAMRLTVIMVVHDANVDRAHDVYQFFRELGVDTLSFNPRFLRGEGPHTAGNIAPGEYAAFVDEMIALRNADRLAGGDGYSLGVADQVHRLRTGQAVSTCFFTNRCHHFVNVNRAGECFVTCSDFVGPHIGSLQKPGLAYILEQLTVAPLLAVRNMLGGDYSGSSTYADTIGPGCPKYSNGAGDIYIGSLLALAGQSPAST